MFAQKQASLRPEQMVNLFHVLRELLLKFFLLGRKATSHCRVDFLWHGAFWGRPTGAEPFPTPGIGTRIAE